MTKRQRRERLFRMMERATDNVDGRLFRNNVADRDMYFALAEGTAASLARGSRMVSAFCKKVSGRIVDDPFDPHTGRFLGDDGRPDMNWDMNAVSFILIHLLSLYYNYFDVLRPRAQKDLLAAIRIYARAEARRKMHFGYSNIALMGICNGILCGELLGDREMAAAAFRRLEGWLEFTALAGGPSEFNSPTYSGVCLHVVGALESWTKDPVTRLVASIALERLWLHVANNYHQPTAQLGGAHSRAYHLDITFNPALAKCALYAEIGDERLMGPNHTPHDADWSLYGIEARLPAHIRPVIEEKEYPYQAREVVSVYMKSAEFGSLYSTLHGAQDIVVVPRRDEIQVPRNLVCPYDDIGVRGETTCYQAGLYSLGTVANWPTSEQRDTMFATWVHEGMDEWDFFRNMFDRFSINGKRAPWFGAGRSCSCQEGGTALVSHRVPHSSTIGGQSVGELKVTVCLPHRAQFDEIRVGAGAPRKYPVPVEGKWLFLRDGDVYIGLLPLKPVGVRGHGSVELVSRGSAGGFNLRIENQETDPVLDHCGDGKPHCLELRFLLYKGKRRRFRPEDLADLRCGYVVEMSSREEVGSFDDFCNTLSRAKLKETRGAQIETYTYRRKGRKLVLKCGGEEPEEAPKRYVDGKEIVSRSLVSPLAVQGREHLLRLKGCTLKKGDAPVWFVADRNRKRYVITNPGQLATPIDLKTPDGTVHVEALGCGRLTCTLGDKPAVLVESVRDPGRVSTSGLRNVALKVRLPARPRA